MAFWGVEVKVGKPFTLKATNDAKSFHLSQATLGLGNATVSRSILQCGGKVIKGLSSGVEGMRAGDKRRLIIPPSLGYTEEGVKKEDVPKNLWLVYEVEAVKVR